MGKNSLVSGHTSSGVSQTVAIARAQLDDLMAELEAGARFVERIQSGLATLNGPVTQSQRNREELAQLATRLGDLRASVRQQRALMTQLREGFDTLRRQVGRP
jgi:predicted RNase H-like nuclease (RuvC/YqgF family)